MLKYAKQIQKNEVTDLQLNRYSFIKSSEG